MNVQSQLVPQQALRTALTWLLKIFISVLLLAWFFSTRNIDWQNLKSLLSQLHVSHFLLATILWVILLALGGWRWKVLLSALNMPVTNATCIRLTLAAVFFSTISFGPLAADGLRTWWMSRIHPGRTTAIIITLVVDRICGLVALGMICLAIFPSQWSTLISKPSTAAILGIVLSILGGTLLLLLFSLLFRESNADTTPGWIQHLPLQKQRKDLAAAIGAYWCKPQAAVQALMISLIIQSLSVLSGLFIFWSLRLEFPILYGASTIPLINVLQALPITIMGLGIRETTVAELFRHITQFPEPALAFSLLNLLINLLGAFVGLICWLTLKTSKS